MTKDLPDAQAPFFVVGSDRSGTTMLMMMLDSNPGLGVSRESWFLIDLMDALPLHGPLSRDELDKAFEIIRGHPRWKNWNIADAALNDALKKLTEPDFAELVEAVFALDLNASGKSRWGDKTPAYVCEIARLHSVFPKAQFVHIIRDARDVCISLRKVGWHGPTLVHMARYWREHVGVGIQAGKQLGDALYLEIPYETIVTDVESTLRRICSFLGEPFDQSMLTWHELTATKTAGNPLKFQTKLDRAPRPSDIGRWKNELSAFQVAIVEVCAGDVMEEAGQELRFPKGIRVLWPLLGGIAFVLSMLVQVRRYLLRKRS